MVRLVVLAGTTGATNEVLFSLMMLAMISSKALTQLRFVAGQVELTAAILGRIGHQVVIGLEGEHGVGGDFVIGFQVASHVVEPVRAKAVGLFVLVAVAVGIADHIQVRAAITVGEAVGDQDDMVQIAGAVFRSRSAYYW